MFIPRNAVCFEVHLGFLPSGWGLAEKTAKLAIGWIFSNTRCQRVFASIPEYNRLTLRLAKSAGMEEFGVNKASFLKDGKLRDQILMGLSKGG
jgi:RimJ/RimL family protein N-acetyltransferase